jgi:Ca2+-binding EF-hand superfamily protein
MKLAKSVMVGAAALALAVGSAYAADNKTARSDPEPGFNKLDKNNDGHLTRAEAAADKDLAKRFKEADRDGDGKLSRTEYLTVKAKKDANTAKEKVGNAVDKVKEKNAEAKAKEPAASTGASTPKDATGTSKP